MKEFHEIPSQPDGIDDYSDVLPSPRDAARRVRAYVASMGDGLYGAGREIDGTWRPLYGRDLEAICRAAMRLPSSCRECGRREGDGHKMDCSAGRAEFREQQAWKED